ncbi:MAG: SufS family cysteine desulfurase [Planctomycetales bacterium]|nr:SufS family cysteine desulfurase [Planctomycetales bacterium]
MQSNLADKIRGDFPILSTTMNGHPLVYLDNGASTQKPQAVIDALVEYYSRDNANIHRGLYELSQRATDAYEAARSKVASLLGAKDPAECIFVRGTTEAINLVATSWGGAHLGEGDEVLLTGSEHHSNIVPWQMVCQRRGAKIRVLPVDRHGELELGELNTLLTDKTRMVAVQHVSNALGTIHNLQPIIARAREVGARILIDGAQWVGHYATQVLQLDCDFYAFSGHKLYGPTGIGVLWGKRELLESIPAYQGGGDMIESVTFEKTTYAALPNRFEAGTPHIAGAIALGAAVDYVQAIGFEAIGRYEHELLDYATEQMRSVPGLRIVGPASHKASVLSFVLEAPPIAALDVATALSQAGIAIRTGHHCCMPLMEALQIPGTCRASLAMYNTADEVDRLVTVLQQLVDKRVEQAATRPEAESAELSFAPATAESISAAAQELQEEFLLFDDAQSKTELLMELGQGLPHNFDALKAISTAVPGCMSEVYLIGRPVPSQADKFEFVADSNAEIVRGLIALLQAVYSGQSASEVLEFDSDAFFRRIGLEQFVSTQRRSGLEGMIRRIRTLASSIVDRQAVEGL